MSSTELPPVVLDFSKRQTPNKGRVVGGLLTFGLNLIMLYSLELEIFPEQETCDWLKISELKDERYHERLNLRQPTNLQSD
jgi:hypothetical protein